MKRLFDVILALGFFPIALLVSSVFGLLFFILTKESPIFIQSRVGKNKVVFSLFKLRTLPQSIGNIPTHKLSENDIPRIGKLMRKIKVDELPQLLNVLTGDMSLVGPRPCLPTQTDLVSKRDENGVFSIRPGITGSAQVAGLDMSNIDELVKVDQMYVKIHSLALDMKIIFFTLIGHGNGDRCSR